MMAEAVVGMVDMTPVGEEPEDVARVVVFLASSDADYMRGHAINVIRGACMY